MRHRSVFVRLPAASVLALAVTSMPTLSAHVVKGLESFGAATAFVSSPSTGTDLPISVKWGSLPTGDPDLRVVCFFVANTSVERVDRPGWPRVTGAGFELPGTAAGFALIEPVDDHWELIENTRATLNGAPVTLDFAIVARVNPTGRTPGHPHNPLGIPPGDPSGIRGTGTRFCVSGPFPRELVSGQATTIEQLISGVVVRFDGVDGPRGGRDLGVWDSPGRHIPLFP